MYSTYISDIFLGSSEGFMGIMDLIVRSVSLGKENFCGAVFVQGCQTLIETLKFVRSVPQGECNAGSTGGTNFRQILLSIFARLLGILSEPLLWIEKPIFFK